MGEAGIVVVTHESEADIGACLDRAQRTGAAIVVVDNASTDHTCDEVTRRGVRLIANPDNRGFAAAVNQGIRALDTPMVLLLNPDALLETGLDALIECCRQPGVAGAGGKLVDAGGRPQAGFAVRSLPSPAALICEVLLVNRLWPGNPVNWHYRCLGFDFAVPSEVEQPAGAFLMIRRDVWEELQGFDEQFCPHLVRRRGLLLESQRYRPPHALYTWRRSETHRRALHRKDFTGESPALLVS